MHSQKSSHRQPVMYVFAGNNGSGKSTLRDLFMNEIGLGSTVDPDAIAREIDPENPEKASLAAGRVAIERINKHINQREVFNIETTLSSKLAIKQMLEAKKAGFEIVMFYLGLADVEMNIQRVELRVEQGGHNIHESDIRRRHTRSIEALIKHIEIPDRIVVWDNVKRDARDIMVIEKGIIVSHTEEMPDWAQMIYSQLSNR